MLAMEVRIQHTWSCFDERVCEFQCVCYLFEFRGIVCRHTLTILAQKNVNTVRSKYVLNRWGKDVKRRHTYIAVHSDVLRTMRHTNRFERLPKLSQDIGEMERGVIREARSS